MGVGETGARMRCPKTRWSVALAGLFVVAATGCSSPDMADGTASSSQASPPAAPAAAPVENGAAAAAPEADARPARVAAAVAQRWGLDAAPMVAPARSAAKPELVAGPGVIVRGPGLPPVVSRVPTTEKVVFLTIDDGAEKDPRFTRMMRELGIPYSSFVAGYLARSDYGYFRDSMAEGNAVHNHTMNHKDLRKLSESAQREEICGQQDELERETGQRPHLFRPPYGEYTEATLRVAASCGITALALWNEEVFPDRMEWRYDHRLKPGDIVLSHFRGPHQWGGDMTDMVRQFLNTVTEQGFAVARLEDYL